MQVPKQVSSPTCRLQLKLDNNWVSRANEAEPYITVELHVREF